MNTPAFEGGAQFSPDGKWVAFSSNESGQFQVFVKALEGSDCKWPVSQSGSTRNGIATAESCSIAMGTR